MEKIKQGLCKAFPTIKVKEYIFLELDYNEMFCEKIPDYIIKMKGIRIWEREDGYDIQQENRFEMGLSAEKAVELIKANYEMMVREAKIEERAKKAKELQKEQDKKEKMKEALKIEQDNLSLDTLEFLTSIKF